MIAPNLNEALYLPSFLGSLANQSFSDFEIVIVDGYSSDRSLEILESYHATLNLKVVKSRRRNIGYIRNVGANFSLAPLMFHTNSDVVFPPDLLRNVVTEFNRLPHLVSLTGRTIPIQDSIPAVCYSAFDFLRYLLTKAPYPLHRYRPGGSFIAVRRETYFKSGGFPIKRINEDGLLGENIDNISDPSQVKFNLELYIYHYAKRFKSKGTLRTLMFYSYVFSNLFPVLNPFFSHIERRSAETFTTRSDL